MRKHGGYMHNKICLIEERVLFTGLLNWSKNAKENNEEDMLVFTDFTEVLNTYNNILNISGCIRIVTVIHRQMK